MSIVHTHFIAGASGAWQIDDIAPVRGAPLAMAPRLAVVEANTTQGGHHTCAGWRLQGVASNTRYATRREVHQLAAVQEDLGRPQATRAALIPIRKSAAWWALAQDERRSVIEQSHHIAIGLDYLPAVSRRLYHSRELGQPFDFLTWFEYAPADSDAFEDLVARLRKTAEWRYVEREVDVRLTKLASTAKHDWQKIRENP